MCPLRDSNRFSNHITINLILNIYEYHALFMGNVDIISGISTLLTIGFIPPPFPVHFAFYPLHFVLLFLFWPLLPVHFAFSPICFVLAFLFRPLLPVHFAFPFFGFVLASIFRPLPPVHSAFTYFVCVCFSWVSFSSFVLLNRKGSVSAAFSTFYQFRNEKKLHDTLFHVATFL